MLHWPPNPQMTIPARTQRAAYAIERSVMATCSVAENHDTRSAFAKNIRMIGRMITPCSFPDRDVKRGQPQVPQIPLSKR